MMGNAFLHFFDPAQNVTVPVTEARPLPVTVDTEISVDIGSPTISVEGGYIGNGAQAPNFAITTAGVELKVGVTALNDRHTVTIINDSSYPIGISVGTLATYANSIKLASGNYTQLSVNPNAYVPVYARTHFFDTTVCLIESSDG